MIVVRDVFRLRFGQAKAATPLWRDAAAALRKSGYGARDIRLLTDVAGPDYYTIVLESTYDSVAQWEEATKAVKANKDWADLYRQIIALTEKGHREILSVIE